MKTITMDEVQDILQTPGIPVISVLDRTEFDRGHLPGSQNIPVDDPDFLDEVVTRFPEKDAPLVVYCAGGECDASERAAHELEDVGYLDIYAYDGGMKEWVGAGREIEIGAETEGQEWPGTGER